MENWKKGEPVMVRLISGEACMGIALDDHLSGCEANLLELDKIRIVNFQMAMTPQGPRPTLIYKPWIAYTKKTIDRFALKDGVDFSGPIIPKDEIDDPVLNGFIQETSGIVVPEKTIVT